MSEPSWAGDKSGEPGADPRGSRTLWGFVAVLALVTLMTGFAQWPEIGRAYGWVGERGEFEVETCSRDLGYAQEEQRARCVGVFTPDHGGEPVELIASLAASPGDVVRVGVDGSDDTAYRADALGRWGAVGLPLIPLALLWLVPGSRWLLSIEGQASRRQRLLYLASTVAPAAMLLVAGVGGLIVAIAIS